MAEETTFTLDEVKEYLKNNGLDISDFAKTAKALKNGEIKNPKKKQTQRPSETTWELKLAKYPDFIIERKTPKTTKQLVIMPTQAISYIKEVEKEIVEELNMDSYVRFTAGMPTIKLPDDFWTTSVESGKNFYEKIMNPLRCQTYINMIKDKCAPKIDQLSKMDKYDPLYTTQVKAYQAYRLIYKEFYHDDEIRPMICDEVTELIEDMIANFGLNNTRDFLRSWKQSLFKKLSNYMLSNNVFKNIYRDPTSVATNHFGSSCRPQFKMDYKSFKNYVLYQSVRMGYGGSAYSFWREWYDTLKMQKDLYGKIKEKYPNDLPMYHNQLSYKTNLNKAIIDEKKFNEMSKLTQKYEMNIEDYIFVAPRDKKNFFDAATFLCNCLAGYVNSYTEGRCHIIFMQNQKDPNELVAIELRGDKIIQAYQEHNHNVTNKQQDAIDKWLEKVIKINSGEISGEKLEELGKHTKEIINKYLKKEAKDKD